VFTQLFVKNHSLIDCLEIEFGAGLSAITGETGAGKSILLAALGLTLRDRADASQVREGADRAEIQAHFDLAGLPAARDFLESHSLDESADCVLRRVINAGGASKAWINGRPATLGLLRELAEHLISIHSQHEHQRLLRPEHQLLLLDNYAGQGALRREVARAFEQWTAAAVRLRQLRDSEEEQRRRGELLRFHVEELQLLDLAVGEFAALEREQQTLAGGDEILARLAAAADLLSDAENFNALSAVQRLVGLTAAIDAPGLPEVRKLLESAGAQLEEVRALLRNASEQVQPNPQRLAEVEARLSAAFDLARKHRCEADHLPVLAAELQAELEALERAATDAGALGEQVAAFEAEYRRLAGALSEQRRRAAGELATAVEREFAELNMAGAGLRLQLTPIEPAARGLEKCEFLVRTNPGQAHKPLARIASGGEISRISLAIGVVTAASSQNPTLIFDEVDAGIGGATAASVGNKLRQLSRNAQVICITHLAQVAARADRQLLVAKSSDGAGTQTRIRLLGADERRVEIARMLSGDSRSEYSIQHAEELLRKAGDSGS